MKPRVREATFREWIRVHQGILIHIARVYADGSDRDDLLQEMLLAVWHAVPTFRADASEATFIYRIAQNTAFTWHRRLTRQLKTESLRPEHDRAAPTPDGIDHCEALYRAIRGLPEADRTLALMYLDEMSYREMAEVLGISESNVGVRLHRIRKRLADHMTRNDADKENES